MICTKCKKNMAVVFITKVDEKGTSNEGYCLSCATELNIAPVNDLIQNMGIDPKELDELNKDMQEMLSSAFEDEDEDMSNVNEKMPFAFMRSFLSGSSDDDENKDNNKGKKPKKLKNLDKFGTNLTAKARNGLIDEVIGRKNEIDRVSQILNRRSKNNPVLIGEPGVGKTAIAEGLALRIAAGCVPAKLLNYEVYLLDLTMVVAGTQFRGQFEGRLKNIIDEAKNAKNIILVIDEVHTIVAAGDAEGAMSAGNILKPALAKGEIQVIGATTLTEYRKHIEKDSALERRFQPVMVEETTVDETIEIIKGIKKYYEDYHKVKITDEVIRSAVVMSKRYINDRFLPDKAIDLIDEAGAKVNLNNNLLADLEKHKIELKKVSDKKEEAANADSAEAYRQAAYLKSQECKLLAEIMEIEKNSKDIYLTTTDIAEVVESWTKIPVKRITETESERLIKLEELIREGFVGQDEAVEAVASAIRRGRAGIYSKSRPVSLIFVGPTGVGKTELVKQLARVMFDDEDALIRLDMSEFMEKHSVSKMMGSPPGYVGYDEAGQFTEKVRRHPYSIILLDEIEKAHPDVFNTLLQIMDEGKMTDSQGRRISFENTIIIMTSNAGSNEKSNIAGFGGEGGIANSAKIDRALKDIFRPEFLNRVDEIVKFNELTKQELMNIITLMINELNDGLNEKGMSILITDEAKEYILEHGYDSKYGARPLRRYIRKNIDDRLSEILLRQNDIKDFTISVSEGALTVSGNV